MPIFNHGLPIPRKKVESGGVDTSADTVTPEVLVKDYTAHDAEGKPIVGVLDVDAVRDEAVEAGKKAEYDTLWDSLQDNGNRTDYARAFIMWGDTIFRPKYSMQPTHIAMMFYSSTITNVKETLESRGLTLDTSKCTHFTQAFQSSATKEVPFLDMSAATNASSAFNGAKFTSLHIKVSETMPYVSTFDYMRSLTRITVEGTIGKSGFNVSWSPLDKASLTSIVNALSTTTTGLTVTLRLAAVNTAFETSPGAADGSTSDEWWALVATKANWTFSLINS